MQENCPQEPEKCFSECRAPTFVRPFYSAERSENPALHCARSQVASSFVFLYTRYLMPSYRHSRFRSLPVVKICLIPVVNQFRWR